MSHALFPRVTALGTLLLVGSTACSQAPILTQPRSFDRPGRSSLVCFDVTMSPPAAVPLARCSPVDPAVATLPSGFDLHALVLQSRRGEIAVVQLKSNVILDTNTTIPGYTFVEAGALPIDLVSSRGITEDQPITTYVANSGTEDIWVFASSKFRAPATTARAESQRVALNARPSAVVLTPDEHFLVVALPTLGVIRQFPIGANGLLGDGAGPIDPDAVPPFTDIALLTDIPEPLVAEPEATLYEHVCSPATLARPTTAPTRVARIADPLPSPVVLLADDVTQELLVGDSALPVVHRFPLTDAGVGAEAAPLAIGTPVQDLALTPFVPSTLDSGVADRRYLYALDDTGAIAVMDVSDPVDFPGGRPISVEIPTARAQDRITFASPATALTMIATRDYNPAAPAPFCTDLNAATAVSTGPARLHGVFLAASLTDGTVRFVDVYDRDANCRGSAGACAGRTAATGDSVVYVRRHRPRIGSLVSTDLGVLGAPTMSVLGVAFAIGTDGTAASNTAPDLAVLGASCSSIGASFVQAFPPDEGNDLICAVGDPWAATQERWTATYEGAIVSGVAGSFGACDAEGRCAFRANPTDFCRAGVIGQNGAAGLPVPPAGVDPVGDQLVITGDLPPGETRGVCTDLVLTDAATSTRVVLAFDIIEADDDGTLIIGRQALGATAHDFSVVADCFAELVAFEVRSRGSWIVRGSFSGLVRPTTEGPECRVSPVDSDGRVFRAYSNGVFQSRAIAFKIDSDTPPAPGMTLTFDLGGLPQTLGVDLTPMELSGSIPVEIFYSAVDNKLYAVDAGRAALTRIGIDNVSAERLFQ